MDLSHVIVGPVVTEKAEALKLAKTYTLRIAPKATKIDVKNALKAYYDVDVAQVRSLRVPRKTRSVGRGTMEKRHGYKKVLVTLSQKSKALDISSFTS